MFANFGAPRPAAEELVAEAAAGARSGPRVLPDLLTRPEPTPVEPEPVAEDEKPVRRPRGRPPGKREAWPDDQRIAARRDRPRTVRPAPAPVEEPPPPPTPAVPLSTEGLRQAVVVDLLGRRDKRSPKVHRGDRWKQRRLPKACW